MTVSPSTIYSIILRRAYNTFNSGLWPVLLWKWFVWVVFSLIDLLAYSILCVSHPSSVQYTLRRGNWYFYELFICMRWVRRGSKWRTFFIYFIIYSTSNVIKYFILPSCLLFVPEFISHCFSLHNEIVKGKVLCMYFEGNDWHMTK